MFNLIKAYEKLMIRVLMVMMAVVLALSTIDLGWRIISNIIRPPFFFMDIDHLLELFGLFMLVIIGLELLETIMKSYLSQSDQHYEVVLSVAIIAIARKVIILDLGRVDGPMLVGIAAIVIALTAGYFLMKKSAAIRKD
ncbi:phosphate-starvation-inducible PsiE family protein [Candidatus Fermentibacteria bacterium]|nr:phosphate-starvation-inducible PsiE family protein [Candidatus Fermentibacteria bacterium]